MRKKYTAGFKFKVALAAAREDRTVIEICREFEVAQSLVHKWKKELLNHGAEVFADTRKVRRQETDHESKLSKLYEKVGQLTVERDYLKKTWDKLQGSSD